MRAGKYGFIVALLAAFACSIAGSATARTLAAPTIANFAPKSGAMGTKVTIVGTNLAGATVSFNGATATTVTVNKWGNALVAVVPNDPDQLGVGVTGPITVTTPGGMAMTSENFTVTASKSPPRPAKPQISSFRPMAGKAGVTVTLRGSHLDGALVVKFGGVKATFRVPSQTKILATVPSKASSGKISVRTRAGTALSAGRFTVIPSAQA
jgi:hypothetical protein